MTAAAQLALPPRLVELLDGERLADKAAVAFVLMTGDADGWCHAALLSVGEILARSERELGLALHRGSGTTANLTRTGRGTLLIVDGPAAHTVRLEARRVEDPPDAPLARFRAAVASVIRHEVPYARLTSPITFELADPAATRERWSATLAGLRSCA